MNKFVRPIAAAGSAIAAVAIPAVAQASVVLAESVSPWWASFLALFR
jgi:hypothetical protein